MVRRLIVAITGASGTVYGIRILQVLRQLDVETHLVISPAGQLTRDYETDVTREQLEGLACVVHRPGDIGAAISSGSFVTEGMVVAPCSMRSLAEIANGMSTSLVTRAADVVLKERRPLVLMTREAPLSLIHLRNMVAVTEAGATVFPPAPGFYSGPATIEDLVDHTVGRVLDQFGMHTDVYPRWTGGTRRVAQQHRSGQAEE